MRVFAVALVLVAVLAAGAAAADEPAKEPIRFGLSLGLSGKYAELGRMQRMGYELWRDRTNASGGLLGRPVVLDIRDDESDPERAAAIYRGFVAKGGGAVDLVFAPYSSTITEAVASITEEAGYPLLAAGASANAIWEQGRRYVFGVYTPASRYAIGFLEMLVMHGIDDLAVISPDDAFSLAIAHGAEKWAKRLGLEVVYSHRFAKGERDLVEIARQARTSGANAVVVCGHFLESVDMRRALAEIGWRPRAYYASVGPALAEYGRTLGALAEGTFSSTQWDHLKEGGFPGSDEFHERFVAAYGVEPSYQAAAAYAAGQIFSEALRRVGGIDLEELRNQLATLDLLTILGRYGVDARGMQVRHFPLIIQWRGGRKVFVWPPELAGSEPVLSP